MRRSIVALSLVFLASTAFAAANRPITLGEKCNMATKIVVGSVTQIACRWQGNIIVTDITLQPTQYLKGTGTGPLTFTIPGGQIGNVKLSASETPKFTVGEETLVFLRQGVAVCDVYGWNQGKYTFVNNVVAELPGISKTEFIAQINGILAHEPR